MKKQSLILILLMIPAQLCAIVTTVVKFKNKAGRSITYVGYIPEIKDELNNQDPEYAQLTKNHQTDFINHLCGKENIQLVVDQHTIEDAARNNNIAVITIDNGIKNDETSAMPFPAAGLQRFTIEYYQALLKKCIDLQDSITALNNHEIKINFNALQSLLEKQEKQLRYFHAREEDPRDYSIDEIMDYEDLICNLLAVEKEISRYTCLASLIYSQQKDLYVYTNDLHVNTDNNSIVSLNDFAALGYALVFKQSGYEQAQSIFAELLKNDLEDHHIISLLKLAALNLKSVLADADNA